MLMPRIRGDFDRRSAYDDEEAMSGSPTFRLTGPDFRCADKIFTRPPPLQQKSCWQHIEAAEDIAVKYMLSADLPRDIFLAREMLR